MRKRLYAIFLALVSCLATSFGYASEDRITFSFTQWKPMTFTDGAGNAKGVFVDIAREIFEKRHQIEIVYHPLPWKRAQWEVEHGKADFMVTVPTDQRIAYAKKSTLPFYTVDMALFTWNGHPKTEQLKAAKTVDDLIHLGVTSVTNLGNGWHKQNVEEKGVHTLIAPEDQNIALMLAGRRADIMIDSKVSMNRIVKELGLADRIVQIHPSFAQIHMNLLLSKKSPWLSRMPEFDRSLTDLISDGSVGKIIDAYIER